VQRRIRIDQRPMPPRRIRSAAAPSFGAPPPESPERAGVLALAPAGDVCGRGASNPRTHRRRASSSTKAVETTTSPGLSEASCFTSLSPAYVSLAKSNLSESKQFIMKKRCQCVTNAAIIGYRQFGRQGAGQRNRPRVTRKGRPTFIATKPTSPMPRSRLYTSSWSMSTLAARHCGQARRVKKGFPCSTGAAGSSTLAFRASRDKPSKAPFLDTAFDPCPAANGPPRRPS